MFYFHHIEFIQNLAKTPNDAINKCKQLGIVVDDEEFEFDLKHYTKPSVEAFGAKMQFKNGKWYAKATEAFWMTWRQNKEGMKKIGWFCSRYEGNKTLNIQPCWYMFYKPSMD